MKKILSSIGILSMSAILTAAEFSNYSQPGRFDSALYTVGLESYSRDLTIDDLDANLATIRDLAGLSTGSEDTTIEQSRLYLRYTGRAMEKVTAFAEGSFLSGSGGEFEDGDWFLGLRLGAAFEAMSAGGFSAVLFGNGLYTFNVDSGIEGKSFGGVDGIRLKDGSSVRADTLEVTGEKIEMWDATAGILFQYDIEVGEDSPVVITPYAGVDVSIFEAIQKVDYDVTRTERVRVERAGEVETVNQTSKSQQRDRMVLGESDVVGLAAGIGVQFAECWHLRAEGRFANQSSFSLSLGCDL